MIEALVFDVFGTLVDWRSGVAREAARLLGPNLDAERFADDWRARYQPGMEPVRRGERPFVDLDVLHAESLPAVLEAHGVPDPGPATRAELVAAWHRLDAWPEVADALARLRERFLLAPVSNAHIRLAVAHARRNGFPWDAVLGAEIAQDYKPKPAVYESAAAALRLPHGAVMMVAAHSSDLAAAAACGLRTAHVARPLERGSGGGGECAPSVPVDHAAADLADLARRLLDA